MNSKTLKKFVESYNVYECVICKNSGKWENKCLRLQVDHIDGNSSNNEINNLRFLCPNCHSQTLTFTGRNAKNKNFNKPSKEEFINLYKVYSVKEISIIKAVSLRVVYHWFKLYIKEDKKPANRKLSCFDVSNILISDKSEKDLSIEYSISVRMIDKIKKRLCYRDCN